MSTTRPTTRYSVSAGPGGPYTKLGWAKRQASKASIDANGAPVRLIAEEEVSPGQWEERGRMVYINGYLDDARGVLS